MIKNYLLVGIRSLKKHLGYSVINVTGLGLGLAICLLLVLWIRHETSYDTFHTKADRIYRASLEYSFGGQVAKTAVSPTALLPALLSIPETETAVRVYNASASNPFIVRKDDAVFHEKRFFFADSSFFKVFSYTLLKGNPEKALTEPYSVILTTSTARKYFGNEDPIGKTLQINNLRDYTVTGVMENPPSNSFLQFEFLASFRSLRAAQAEPIWWSANYQTFVVPHTHANVAALEEKTNEIVKNALQTQLTGDGDYVRYNFMLMKDIHLHSQLQTEPEVVGDIKYVYIFSAIALLILIIACINYVNLSTARASDRAKEVGIRKVIGALRKQLFWQFVSESFIITLLAFILAFFLAQLLLPFFNQLTGKTFQSTQLLEPSFIASAFAGLVLIAGLAGAYPALAITAFKPVSVLKGNFKTSSRGIWLRQSLVVFQFCISVVLIIGTLVITKQLSFIQQRKLGYDRNNVLMLPYDEKTNQAYDALRTELIRTGVVKEVARGSEAPTAVRAGYSINTEGDDSPGIIITGLIVDEHYLPAMGMELISGRNFTETDVEYAKRDTLHTFILNESAMKQLLLTPEETVGKRVSMGGRKGEIIGVVRDFHFSSLHHAINPLVIFPEHQNISKMFIKLEQGNVTETLATVKRVYATLLPHRPFEYQFLDQQFAALYEAEQRMGSIFIVFALLAIIIACLGLLGLVSFSAAQKTKEIGIRKVLGATVSNIIILITRDFAKLVILAIILGLPVAWWIMTQWLNDFAYKTEIGMGPIVIASLLSLVIAFGTSAFQALKAALINPAETLRNE